MCVKFSGGSHASSAAFSKNANPDGSPCAKTAMRNFVRIHEVNRESPSGVKP